MWREADALHGGQWRGCIDHVASGRRLFFANLAEIIDFISLRTQGGSGTTADR